MWISRESGRAIFPIFIRDNAIATGRTVNNLFMEPSAVEKMRALPQRDPRGKVPSSAKQLAAKCLDRSFGIESPRRFKLGTSSNVS
jgi:hypothetical protein